MSVIEVLDTMKKTRGLVPPVYASSRPRIERIWDERNGPRICGRYRSPQPSVECSRSIRRSRLGWQPSTTSRSSANRGACHSDSVHRGFAPALPGPCGPVPRALVIVHSHSLETQSTRASHLFQPPCMKIIVGREMSFVIIHLPIGQVKG